MNPSTDTTAAQCIQITKDQEDLEIESTKGIEPRLQVDYFLACLEYRKAWKADTWNIYEYGLSNIDFRPRYLHNKRFEAVHVLECLPVELRQEIYGYVVYSWSKFKPYAESSTSGLGWGFEIARRNRKPMYGSSVIDLPYSRYVDEPCKEPKNCLKSSQFQQRLGTLDYFKDCEWDSVMAFFNCLGNFRKSAAYDTEVRFRLEKFTGRVDGLEDFRTWFWNEVVFDIMFRANHFPISPWATSTAKVPSPLGHIQGQLQHVTFGASIDEASSDWFYKRMHAGDGTLPLRGENGFIQRCKCVITKLPNLQTVSLFIEMHPEAILQTEEPKYRRKGPVARFKAMLPWLRTVLKLPVTDKIHVELFVTPGYKEHFRSCQVGECQNLKLQDELMQIAVGQVFKPLFPRDFEEDQYFGLADLFDEGEACDSLTA